ncbi:hypothetical protein RR46_12043 [Papilio xuthus]|uniref:Uncharacterized protein n=1 Tax=Papilio xuthus TaxID=66420 RepID=A0A194PQM2_PAPXU|nr:hypothetical protein RR46_12043 [Papilio xuthus]
MQLIARLLTDSGSIVSSPATCIVANQPNHQDTNMHKDWVNRYDIVVDMTMMRLLEMYGKGRLTIFLGNDYTDFKDLSVIQLTWYQSIECAMFIKMVEVVMYRARAVRMRGLRPPTAAGLHTASLSITNNIVL